MNQIKLDNMRKLELRDIACYVPHKPKCHVMGGYDDDCETPILYTATGVDNSSINKCCKGKLKSAGCFFWKYNKSIEREQVRALEEYNLCEHKNTKTIVING